MLTTNLQGHSITVQYTPSASKSESDWPWNDTRWDSLTHSLSLGKSCNQNLLAYQIYSMRQDMHRCTSKSLRSATGTVSRSSTWARQQLLRVAHACNYLPPSYELIWLHMKCCLPVLYMLRLTHRTAWLKIDVQCIRR